MKFVHRPITKKGVEEFEKKIILMDWGLMYMGNPTESAAALCSILDDLVDECFPQIQTSIKSTDSPWISRPIKRQIRRKRRAYAAEGKSQRYRREKKKAEKMMREGKQVFFEKVKKIAFEERSNKRYYGAVKLLGGKEAPKPFDIRVLFPGKTDQEIANELAGYFNKISREFPLLGEIPANFTSRLNVEQSTPS